MDRCELASGQEYRSRLHEIYLKDGRGQITIMRRVGQEGSEYFEKYSHGIVVNASPVKDQIRR